MADAPLVYRKWANVLAGLSHIPKQRSSGVSYEFRGIDALMQHLHPLLAKEGLVLSPRVLDDWQVNGIPGTKDRIQYQALFRIEVDVWAEDGSCVTLGPGLAQSHDYGDKSVYQAQQNAIKYVLLESLCVPVDEPDMDGRGADPVPADPPDEGKAQHIRELHARVPEGATTKSADELVAWADTAAKQDATITKLETAITEAEQVPA